MQLVFATHNQNKLREVQSLVPEYIKLLSLEDIGCNEDIPETQPTIEGNAIHKCLYVQNKFGYDCFADDTGLEVSSLNGAPGVYTADWAETKNGRDFNHAMTKVWNILDSIKAPKPIKAKFICVLCLAWPDGHDETFEGTISGKISWPMRGKNGFGFDPIFIPDGYKITFAEMEPETKHQINHRFNAFRKLIDACLS